MVTSVKHIRAVETVEALEEPGGLRLVIQYWSEDGRLLGSREEKIRLEEPAPAGSPEGKE